MSNRTVSRYTRPQREDSGIILPEFPLFKVLQGLQEPLAKGTYLKDASPEPVILEDLGLSIETVEQVFQHFRRTPPRISLGFPLDRIQLPMIVLVPESMDSDGEVFGYFSRAQQADVAEADAEILTPPGGAAGGETEFKLQFSPVLLGSDEYQVERGGETIPLFSAYSDYSTTEKGVVTLGTPLQAGDILTCLGYSYYTLPGGEYLACPYEFHHGIIIETVDSVISSALLALVWRQLVLNLDVLTAAGLEALSISRRSFSLWGEVQPMVGHRAELAVAGKVQWSAFKQVVTPKLLDVEISEASSGDTLYRLEMDLNETSISE